jgi:hypothetical protein
MKIGIRLVLVALVAAAGVWLWGVLFPNPEQVIRKRLADTARAASFAPGESYLSRLTAAQRLSGFFATNVEVNIDVPGHHEREWTGREEILQAALGARATLTSLSVTFPDVSLDIAPGKESATADLTAEARMPGEPDPFVQEMKFNLIKVGGEWLITRVQTVQTLENSAH